MHGLALTHDGKAFSWVVNDDSALGRNTEGADSDGENTQDVGDRGDDDEVATLDFMESTPMLVEGYNDHQYRRR